MIVALVAVLIVLVGLATVWPLFFIKATAQPDFIAFVFTEYKSADLPLLPFADNDERLLMSGIGESSINPSANQEQNLVRQGLERLAAAKAAKPLVVYWRSHAMCRDGHVWLLHADADLDSTAHCTELADLLAKMDSCPAKNKLLILDVTGSLADSRHGIIADDVAGRVEEEIKNRPTKGAVVLCACEKGQISLTAWPFQHSAFAWFVADALASAAPANGPIKVMDMAEIVAKNTEKWALNTYGIKQTPKLWGLPANSFVLPTTTRPEQQDLASDDEAAQSAYPKWLRDEWERRDKYLADHVYRDAPRAYRLFEESLLWAEQRWRAGRDQARVEESVKSTLSQCTQTLNEAQTKRELAKVPYSLAGMEAHPDSEAMKALSSFFEGIAGKPPADKNAAFTKFAKTWLEKYQEPTIRAAAIFEFALSCQEMKRPTCEKLTKLLDSTPQATFAETLVLRRLVDDPRTDELGRTWKNRHVHNLLAAVQSEEQAVSGDAIALRPMLREKLDKLAMSRRHGELSIRIADVATADDELETVRKDTEQIAKRAREIAGAWNDLLEASVLLPACAFYVADSEDRGLDAAWKDAIQSAIGLFELFDNAGQKEPAGNLSALQLTLRDS
ncbi:MAG: hypothetical protein ACRD36_02155, partial [Candidatus Acidiferrum sp.]